MDEKIKTTIEKIKLLSRQNEEFNQEMQKLFGKTVSASTGSIPNMVLEDISAIRSALEIRANVSVSYDFVKEQRLRDQLIIDNLRMENAALNLKEKESDRFYFFCVNAFFQLENIVNYYYHILYPNIDDLLTTIEANTANDGEDYRFHRSQNEKYKEKNVGDIKIYHKLNALCNSLFPNDISIKITLTNLRKVRNEGEHRCQIICDEKDENNNLYKFLKNATFDSVRGILIKVVTAIKNHLNSSPKRTKSQGSITSKFESACFVSINGVTTQLPYNLFKKVKNCTVNDEIEIVFLDNKIIDVEVCSNTINN